MSVVASALAASLEAQEAPRVSARDVFAGSELETYLRNLQLSGAVPLYPWSLRGFSPRELDRLVPGDTAHPWAGRYDLAPRAEAGVTVDVVAPAVSVRFNSAFPYGSNDGPVWAGRGLTSAVQGGVVARYRSLSLTIAPMVLRAENTAFRLLSNGLTGKLQYADGSYPMSIDRPQRFGDRPYTLVDPGQSSLRLDGGRVTAGVSTANQYWGPAAHYPAILGNNAGGFPHLFVGTAEPLDFRVVTLHTRLVWGRLSQSAFADETTSAGVRFMGGLVGVLSSRWVPGLEVGLSRFIHVPWRSRGPTLSDVTALFTSRNRLNQAGLARDNQLASVFFRWAFPRSGIEVYGEYGRDDYNADLRDLIVEPDHIGGYTLSGGIRKAIRRAGGRLTVFSGEVMNQQRSRTPVELGYSPMYTNSSLHQGHTVRGQMLGSDAGLGGTGATLALDWYHPRGRWTARWTRVLRGDRGTFLATGQEDPRARDVQNAWTFEALRFRGRYDIVAGITAVYEANRDFRADAFNLNLALGIRMGVR